ncbi:hypothetical protein [Flavobacterium sp.]|jgi:hypothetical protein|uniref:hypothetical protein n=1 Tax=Flavobacterium sp. TaxID=239 RepID=UPI002A7FE841|nr:hypothetical protein [Flavobacterium sp.]
MKKKVILFASLGVFLILAVLFFNKENNTNFKKPSFVSFEEQQVLKDYNWNLIGIEGTSFNTVIKRDNVIVVKYLSLSNEDSQKEIELFNTIYEEYKTKIEFLVIVEDDQLKVRNYLKENDYFFPVCYSLSRPPFKFEPQDKNFRSLIVSRKGRIIMDNFEPINWESNEIRDVLNGLIK